MTAETTTRTRRRRGPLYAALILAFLLLLLVLGYFPQNLLRDYVETRLRESVGPKTRIGRLQVVPGRLAAEAWDLVLEGPTWRLEIPYVRFGMKPGFLVGHSLALRYVEMHEPKLTLWEGPPTDKPRKPLADPLVVDALSARNATIVYLSDELGNIEFDGVQIAGAIGGILDLSGNGTWKRDEPIPLRGLKGRLRVSEWLEMHVEAFSGRVAGSSFTASGSLGKAGEIRPDLQIDADVDLADGRYVPGLPPMEGRLKAEATLKGTLAGQAIDAKLTGERVVVDGWRIDQFEGRVTHDGAEERTELQADARLLGGRAEASGTWATAAADGRLTLRGIDTTRLADKLDLELPFDGSLDGELTAKGDPRERLRVAGQLRAQGDAEAGGTVDARLETSGTLRPETKAIALDFDLHSRTRGAVGPIPDRVQAADLRARGRAEGTLADPRLRGTLQGLVDLTGVQGVEKVPVTGSFRYAGTTWRVDAEGRALGGTVAASLDARGQARVLEARGRSIDLGRLDPQTAGTLRFDYRGRGADPLADGRGTAVVDGLVWRDVVAGDVTADVVGTARGLQVGFAAPALQATGSGLVAKGAFDGTVVLDGTRLETFQPLSPDRPLQGTASGRLALHVPFAEPGAATVEGTVTHLDVRSGELDARATRPFRLAWSAGRVAVEELALVGTGFDLAGSARFGTTAGAPLQADLRVAADLGKLPWGVGWQVSGTASGQVQLSGTVSRPRAQGSLDVSEIVVQPPGRPQIMAREGHVVLDGEFMSTPGLTLVADGGEVLMTGRLPLAVMLPARTARNLGLRRDLPLDARLTGHADLSKLPVREGMTLVGNAEGDVAITGTLDHPLAHGELVVRGASVVIPGRPGVTADETRVVLEGDMVSTTGITLETEQGTVVVSGRLPLGALAPQALADRLGWDRGLPLDVQVHADIDLSKLRVREGWTLVGRAVGDLGVTGTLDRPRAHGELSVEGTTLNVPGRDPIQATDARVIVEGDVITTTGLTVSAANSTITLQGRVPIAAIAPPAFVTRFGFATGLPVDASLKADLDLRDVPLAEPWSASGRARADLAVTGPLDAVLASGAVQLDGAELSNTGATIASVETGSFLLQGDIARTDGITATVAEGTVTLEGTVPLGALLGSGSRLARLAPSPGEADLRMTWDGVQSGPLVQLLLPYTQTIIAGAVTGRANLTGRLADPATLRGEVIQDPAILQVEAVEVALSEVRLAIGAGEIRALQPITLASGDGSLELTGGVDLARRTVEVDGRGSFDVGVLSLFLDSASLSGSAEMALAITGPFSDVDVRGGVDVRDAAIRIREIREAITSINGQLSFGGDTLRLEDMTATLGGGPVRMAGTARLDRATLLDVDVSITGEDLALRYPVGGTGRVDDTYGDIKTRSDIDLALTGDYGDLLLSGDIDVHRALYDVDVFVGSGLFAPEVPLVDSEGSRLLQGIALDIEVDLVNPAVVRNNLAQLQATGDFWVRGDLDQVAPFGRLELQPGGRVFLQDREFAVTSGSLTYSGTLDPDVNVQAETNIRQVGNEDILVRVAAGGSIDYPRLNFSSSPSHPEDRLASLVATGRLDAFSRLGGLSSGAWMVGEQAASLLAGRFTRGVSRGLMGFGFDEVSIQPALLAREGQPGARFTFAKDLSNRLRLIYSFGLNDTEAQYYAAVFRFRPGQDITAGLQRFDDGRYEYSVGQRLRFGGPKRERAVVTEEPRLELTDVRVEGDPPLLAEELLDGVHARTGREVTRFDLLDDAEKMRERLVAAGHLEAEVESLLAGSVATFTVKAGPLFGWRVDGWPQAPELTEVIYTSLYEEEALERGRELLLEELHRQGFLRATVRTRELPEGGNRMLVYEVKPGPQLTVTGIEFPGATVLGQQELVDAAGGPAALLGNPRRAVEGIRRAYHAHQYLAARVDVPRVSETGGALRIVVPVREGERAVIREVRFPGSTLSEQKLRKYAAIAPGDRYERVATELAVQRLRDRYLQIGHPAVRIVPEIEPAGADLDLVFRITEGQRVTAGEVEVTGLRRTRDFVVRRQVDLEPGDPLDPRRLAAIERRLLDLGIFSRATITPGPGAQAPLRIEIEEAPPYRLAYDLRWEQLEGGSVLVDGEVGNVLGLGVSVGGRYRIGSRLREARGSVHVPSITKLGDLTVTVFRTDERLDTLQEENVALVPGREDRRTQQGFQLQGLRRRTGPFQMLFGYRLQRDEDTSIQRDLDTSIPTTPLAETLGALSVSFANDDRVNPLNARRGLFWSFSTEGGNRFLGSDVDFLKGYGMVFLTRPIRGPWTWAQGYRLGLANGLGSPRVSFFPQRLGASQRSERFRAGGPTTLRGFAIDAVGPRDAEGQPLGGQAVVILNQELRWQSESGLGIGAALFYDGGNVWERTGEMGFDLRHSVGAGVRWVSPVGLLRLDVGVPLNRREGEARYRLHFGLGQAF